MSTDNWLQAVTYTMPPPDSATDCATIPFKQCFSLKQHTYRTIQASHLQAYEEYSIPTAIVCSTSSC